MYFSLSSANYSGFMMKASRLVMLLVCTRRRGNVSGSNTGTAAKRSEFKFTTRGASKHDTAIGRIPAIYHLLDVFHNNRPRMESVLNFFVIISKNVLEYIHKTIMKEKGRKRNPLPLKNDGQGS